MIISTQHLLMGKDAIPPPIAPAIGDVPMATAATEDLKVETPPKESESVTPGPADPADVKEAPADDDVEMQDVEQTPKEEAKQISGTEQSTNEASALPPTSVAQSPELTNPSYDPNFGYPGGYPLDLEFEASKLPLDVAVFNSTRACNGGDEKIRKYLQAVLVVGGTSLIPGMAHALESRLQAIATPLVKNMEKVQIIPPPKDVDPRSLVWKGACVLAKMDSVNDMWVTPSDWDKLEVRAIRERCFFL